MAQFEEVGVRAVVQGYDRFIFQITSMGRSITGLSAAGATAAGGIGLATAAIGALVAAAAAATAIVVGVGAAVISLGAQGVETARSFETAFAGVLKTTNNLGTNLYDLTESGEAVFQQFRDLAKEIPLSFEELSKIGEFAGQLGIPEEALASFTNTVAALGVSTELTTEQAALGLARIANVYGVAAEDMASNTERMGSTLAWLGNNTAAMEDEILIFARNIAGTTSALGVSQDELFAIGAAFTAAGNTAEAGGSSVQRVLLEMSKAVQSGGEDLEKWAEATGLTAEEFASQWGTQGGPAKTFLAFMQQLNQAGEGASAVLGDLDIDTIRVIRTMLSAAGAVDQLEFALTGANTAWDENTALTREASIRYETFDSKAEMIQNRFRDLSFTIGSELIPTFMPFLDDVITPFIEGLELGVPGASATVAGALREDLIPALTDLAEAFGLTDPESVAQAIEGIGEAIAGKIESISEFTSSVAEFVELYRSGDLVAAFESIGIEEQDAVKLEAGAEAIYNMGQTLREMIEDKDNIGSLFETIGTKIKDYALTELLKFIFWLDGAINLLNVLAGFVEFFLEGLPTFTGVVDDFAQGLGEVFKGNISLGDLLSGAFTPEGAGMGTGEDPLEMFVEFKLEGIMPEDGSEDPFQEFLDRYNQTLEERTPELAENTKTSFDNVFTQFGEEIKPTIEETMNITGDEMSTSYATKMDEIEPIMEGRARELGLNIVKGISSGILSEIAQLEAMAANAITGLMDAMEAAAEVSSPSKRGVYVGAMIMEGVSQGLLAGLDPVKNTMMASMAGVMNAGMAIAPQTNTTTTSIDKSFNVGDISMQTNDKSPISLVDNLSMMASLRA